MPTDTLTSSDGSHEEEKYGISVPDCFNDEPLDLEIHLCSPLTRDEVQKFIDELYEHYMNL